MAVPPRLIIKALYRLILQRFLSHRRLRTIRIRPHMAVRLPLINKALYRLMLLFPCKDGRIQRQVRSILVILGIGLESKKHRVTTQTASPSLMAFPPYGFPFQHGSMHPVPGQSSMPYYGYLPVYFPSGPFGPVNFPSPMGYGSTGYGSNGANPFRVGNPAPVPSPSEFPSGDHRPPLSNVPVSTSSPPRIEPARPDIDTQVATSPGEFYCTTLGSAGT